MIRPTVWLTFWKISSASAPTWPASIVPRLLETAARGASVKQRTAWEIRPEGLMPGLADIRGMGNRLRHAYDQMNLDVI
jgi:hypothetical protein